MRRAGVLMPVTSLPSPWGVGTMGAAAREFVDFLVESGQMVWQILPIGPTGFGDSPYQVFSTYAGNPYLIDLDELAAEGLLERSEYEGVSWGDDPLSVDYGALFRGRLPVLERACARLRFAPWDIRFRRTKSPPARIRSRSSSCNRSGRDRPQDSIHPCASLPPPTRREWQRHCPAPRSRPRRRSGRPYAGSEPCRRGIP